MVNCCSVEPLGVIVSGSFDTFGSWYAEDSFCSPLSGKVIPFCEELVSLGTGFFVKEPTGSLKKANTLSMILQGLTASAWCVQM